MRLTYISALPAKLTRKELQHFMTATRKFVNLSEWALDTESNVAGPVEAQAFLCEMLDGLGVTTAAEVPKGPEHKRAGESSVDANVMPLNG